MSKSNKLFIKIVIVILSIPFLLGGFTMSLPTVFGQGTPTAPPTATLQTPNTGNLQFVPQQAYVVPLPPPGVQTNNQFSSGGNDIINMIISGLMGGGLSGIYAKIRGDKNQKIGQENSQMNAKIVGVQQGTLEQVYENMPNKGNEVTNKPEIKLSNVENLKNEALKTQTKA